jgi:hypothetical protein
MLDQMRGQLGQYVRRRDNVADPGVAFGCRDAVLAAGDGLALDAAASAGGIHRPRTISPSSVARYRRASRFVPNVVGALYRRPRLPCGP